MTSVQKNDLQEIKKLSPKDSPFGRRVLAIRTNPLGLGSGVEFETLEYLGPKDFHEFLDWLLNNGISLDQLVQWSVFREDKRGNILESGWMYCTTDIVLGEWSDRKVNPAVLDSLTNTHFDDRMFQALRNQILRHK